MLIFAVNGKPIRNIQIPASNTLPNVILTENPTKLTSINKPQPLRKLNNNDQAKPIPTIIRTSLTLKCGYIVSPQITY